VEHLSKDNIDILRQLATTPNRQAALQAKRVTSQNADPQRLLRFRNPIIPPPSSTPSRTGLVAEKIQQLSNLAPFSTTGEMTPVRQAAILAKRVSAYDPTLPVKAEESMEMDVFKCDIDSITRDSVDASFVERDDDELSSDSFIFQEDEDLLGKEATSESLDLQEELDLGIDESICDEEPPAVYDDEEEENDVHIDVSMCFEEPSVINDDEDESSHDLDEDNLEILASQVFSQSKILHSISEKDEQSVESTPNDIPTSDLKSEDSFSIPSSPIKARFDTVVPMVPLQIPDQLEADTIQMRLNEIPATAVEQHVESPTPAELDSNSNGGSSDSVIFASPSEQRRLRMRATPFSMGDMSLLPDISLISTAPMDDNEGDVSIVDVQDALLTDFIYSKTEYLLDDSEECMDDEGQGEGTSSGNDALDQDREPPEFLAESPKKSGTPRRNIGAAGKKRRGGDGEGSGMLGVVEGIECIQAYIQLREKVESKKAIVENERDMLEKRVRELEIVDNGFDSTIPSPSTDSVIQEVREFEESLEKYSKEIEELDVDVKKLAKVMQESEAKTISLQQLIENERRDSVVLACKVRRAEDESKYGVEWIGAVLCGIALALGVFSLFMGYQYNQMHQRNYVLGSNGDTVEYAPPSAWFLWWMDGFFGEEMFVTSWTEFVMQFAAETIEWATHGLPNSTFTVPT